MAQDDFNEEISAFLHACLDKIFDEISMPKQRALLSLLNDILRLDTAPKVHAREEPKAAETEKSTPDNAA